MHQWVWHCHELILIFRLFIRLKCVNKPYALVSTSEFSVYFKCDCMPNGIVWMFIPKSSIISSHPYQRKTHGSHEKRGWLKWSWRSTGSPGSTCSSHSSLLTLQGRFAFSTCQSSHYKSLSFIAFISFSFISAPVPFSRTFECSEFTRNSKPFIRT